MLSRTSLRPRELIEFFNACIEAAEGKPTVTKECMFKAEGQYSKYRLGSLQDEWITEYPGLIDLAKILKQRHLGFELSEIKNEDVLDLCLTYAVEHYNRTDDLSMFARTVAENGTQMPDFVRRLFYAFYQTGLIGLKINSYESIQWSFMTEATITASSVNLESRAYVHPMYFRALVSCI
jgi:hypothetical protein